MIYNRTYANMYILLGHHSIETKEWSVESFIEEFSIGRLEPRHFGTTAGHRAIRDKITIHRKKPRLLLERIQTTHIADQVRDKIVDLSQSVSQAHESSQWTSLFSMR